MDAFFNELDCRLRVSGMVADSIMMGIVNSAMEDAYKRSFSKEGDIERLIEKSRFCELSIMQLEWCLKYLQDEMDCTIIDNGIDHENMLCDLLETRNRIHCRLEETSMEIASKDVELVRRKENEMKLRLALELKGEEVRSLHSTLGGGPWNNEAFDDVPPTCEKTNTKGSNQKVLDEVESLVDKQFSRVRNKFENGRQTFSDLINSMKTSPRNSPSWDADSDETTNLYELRDMTQLMWDLNEIATDVETLRQEVRSSFETIASCISSFKATIEEERLIRNMEGEIADVIFSSLMNKNADHLELLNREIRRLKDEKYEMEIKAGITDDIFRINLKGLVRGVSASCDREHSYDDVKRIFIRIISGEEISRESSEVRESCTCTTEESLKEKVYRNVFSQVIRGFLSAPKMINSVLDHPTEENKLTDQKLLQNSKDDQFELRNGSAEIHDRDGGIDFMEKKTIEKLSQMMGNFELVVSEKLRKHISRVDDLIEQSSILHRDINSIKKEEELYRRAFICRCYNHQTAEVEVDLLGDQVDVLFNLLKKIYMALDHYSPILQYYNGINEVLKLLHQEIYGDATSTLN